MVSVSELKIRWEWEPGESARVREHAATWARIEIWVGADCVTLVEDVESGSSRRSIYCPLYPLAEWIAYSWWSLQVDARPAREFGFRWPGINSDQQKSHSRLRRHSIRASGDGFLWPSLLIVPEGKHTRIAWQRDGTASAGRPIRFLTQGEVFANHESVMRELSLLVLEVLTRLAEQGIDGTPLQKEWDAISRTTPEERLYCIAAARLGLDPYSEAEPYESSILQAADRFSGNMLDDFLDAVEPDHIDSALDWLDAVDRIIRGSSAGPQRGVIRELRREVRKQLSPQTIFPWETGWRQAELVRNLLDVNKTKSLDLRTYVNDRRRKLSDRGLLAAGAPVEKFDPIVVIGHTRAETSRRFTLARALWHYLWGDENALFLVTTAYTDRQKIERAFAAELLAPADGIAQLLETEPEAASSEDIEQVAQHFRVSPTVIQHQVQNQLLSA